jgi:RNA polymerase sigma-70 factor, ECF subfamily
VGNDREAGFERLCRDEYAAVVRAAWLITGDREEAVDIAQEAFARAYERWRQVARLDRPAAWLQRVAGNLALSWRRRQRVRSRAHRAPTPPPLAETLPDPDLMRALDRLTPAQRAVIVLRYLCDQSIEDVARALGKRPGTVRALTSQGLGRLRDALPTEEVFSDAGE